MPTYGENLSLGGFNPMGNMYMNAPQIGAAGGQGGGWLNNVLRTMGGGLMGTNPVGAGAMALMNLIPGIVGAFGAGSKRKQNKKEWQGAQKAYQQKAASLFPELEKSSFMYQNPELNNAIQGALMYRMQNMFGDWGMPPGRTQGFGSLQDLFKQAFPGGNQQPQRPNRPQYPIVNQGNRGDIGRTPRARRESRRFGY